MQQTQEEFNKIIAKCQSLFANKTKDYGTAWRILRLSSITDQLFIKAQKNKSFFGKNKCIVQDD